jgi:hypothetical protein
VPCRTVTLLLLIAACAHPQPSPYPPPPTVAPIAVSAMSDDDAQRGMVRIHGRAVDHLGNPAAGAVVVAHPRGTTGETPTAITTTDGAYEIVVAPGDLEVTFYYADATIEWRVEAEGGTTIELPEVKLEAGEIIVIEASERVRKPDRR